MQSDVTVVLNLPEVNLCRQANVGDNVVPNVTERDARIVLDLHRGECRGARFVEGDCDPVDADFVIVGSYAEWRDVIEGRLDPIKGMMEGKLKLARGHLPTIIRFVEPSRLVVQSASKVPTIFAD